MKNTYKVNEEAVKKIAERVYDKTFNERADDQYKGSFDTEEEREYWLGKCKEALLNKYNELNN